MLKSKKRAIILDTDPGIDDAVAMAVLFNSCKERIIQVVATYGNIPLEKSMRNASSLMTLMEADNIRLVRGADKPGEGNAVYENASYIHGNDGLGGLQKSELFENLPVKNFVKAAEIAEEDYLKTIYDAIIKAEGVDYITLGPMTNLSALIAKYPGVIKLINQVIAMGGGIGFGNVTKFAEFNFYCDAESAYNVLLNMRDVILVPINITNQVSFSMDQIAEIGKTDTPLAKAMEHILTANYKQCVAHGETGATMHDSTAVLTYLYPELFEFDICGIKIDREKERYGESTITEGNNVKLIKKTNPSHLLRIIIENITGEYKNTAKGENIWQIK